MKVCVLLLLLVAHESFSINVRITDIRNLWSGKVASARSTCIAKSGVNPEIVDGFFTYGRMPDDPCFKCYLLCNGIKLKVFTPTGEVNVKKWMEAFDYIDLPLAHKCTDISDPDPCHKVYRIVKCVHDDLSDRYHPF